MEFDGYRPIEEYALIGNCRGLALVSRDGCIDWACLERFDADPTFSRLLDKRRGGHFTLHPAAKARVDRGYIPRTNVLQTVFRTLEGVVSLTDFMVVPEGGDAASGAHVVRIVRGLAGRVRIEGSYRPTDGFAATSAAPRVEGDRVVATHCPDLISEVAWSEADGRADFSQEIGAGETWRFMMVPSGHHVALEEADTAFAQTMHFWERWSSAALYKGSREEEVIRSALVLKALTYGPSGAVVAAATSSLPEEIGGVRNWDYRFCWIRDACLAFYTLKKFGSYGEAADFFGYITTLLERDDGLLKPLYPVNGEAQTGERRIDHFEGYRGSAPVRAGNEAAEQNQLDVYGQMLDLVYLDREIGGKHDERIEAACRRVADETVEKWREPDDGLWEPRMEPQRYLHAAIMNWVVLDRAIKLFGEEPHWVAARADIVEAVNGEGVHKDRGCLTQTFGGEAVDASLLIAPMVDFPVDRAVFERTVDAIIEDLGVGALVYRYRNDDGLPGEEGTFLICAFWLVDALAWLGRGEEAFERYGALRSLMNDVGLYPEEISREGLFLGNFPQAFSHLAFIHTTFVLDLYMQGGAEAVRGTYADRAKRETPSRSKPSP